MKRRRWNLPSASVSVTLVLLASLLGCSTKQKLDTALDNANKTTKNANQLIDEYKKLAKEMTATLADVRTSAKSVVHTSPAKLAGAPVLPAKVTGGVDLGATMSAKSGTAPADVDGSGEPEDVTVLTAEEGPEFLSWKGDAESDDDGACYLAWSSEGEDWFVVSNCGDTSGAFVCKTDDTTASCEACNTSGDCSPCDMNATDFSCDWPR